MWDEGNGGAGGGGGPALQLCAYGYLSGSDTPIGREMGFTPVLPFRAEWLWVWPHERPTYAGPFVRVKPELHVTSIRVANREQLVLMGEGVPAGIFQPATTIGGFLSDYLEDPNSAIETGPEKRIALLGHSLIRAPETVVKIPWNVFPSFAAPHEMAIDLSHDVLGWMVWGYEVNG